MLVDAAEHGYLTSDLPHPRGEIVVHSLRTTPGYVILAEEARTHPCDFSRRIG
jgi:hypothetical protein